MMIGAIELIGWVVNAVRGRAASRQLSVFEGAFAAGAITLSCLLVFGWMYESLPFDGRAASGDTTVYAWGPFRKPATAGRAVADGWTRYNMLGYEGRPAYPEYHDVVTTMDEIGQTKGCGRALWENSEDNGQYGTTMALDAAAALDRRLHRLDGGPLLRGVGHHAVPLPHGGGDVQAVVQSRSASCATRTTTRTVGVPAHGRSRRALPDGAHGRGQEGSRRQRSARADRHVRARGRSTNSPRRASSKPLTVQPVVVEERDGDQRERNLEVGTSWFQRREDWPALPADDGPDSWQRIPVEVDMEARVGEPGDRSRNVDYVVPAEPIDVVDLPRSRCPMSTSKRSRSASTSTRSACPCSSA